MINLLQVDQITGNIFEFIFIKDMFKNDKHQEAVMEGKEMSPDLWTENNTLYLVEDDKKTKAELIKEKRILDDAQVSMLKKNIKGSLLRSEGSFYILPDLPFDLSQTKIYEETINNTS